MNTPSNTPSIDARGLRERLRDLKRPTKQDFRYPIEAYEDDLVELIDQYVSERIEAFRSHTYDTLSTYRGSGDLADFANVDDVVRVLSQYDYKGEGHDQL